MAKKPSAKAAVLKKPSSKLKHVGNPQPKAASKPKGTVKAKAKATGKEQSNALKMSRSCVYSRAYHQVSHLWKISFKTACLYDVDSSKLMVVYLNID